MNQTPDPRETRITGVRSPGREAWKRLRRQTFALACLVFLAGILALSLLAPALPLPSHHELHLQGQYHPPQGLAGNRDWKRQGYDDLGWTDQRLLDLRETLFESYQIGHVLGTDAKGRDLLARIVWGSRVSLFVGFLAAMVSLVVGVLYGGLSGLLDGRTDHWMMRLVDALYSLPFIFIVIFLLTLMNEYRSELAALGIERIHLFYAVIGLVYWLTMARVVRGQVLSLREKEFVEAARAAGASRLRILLRHLLPNTLPVVLVYLTLTIPQVILFEAFLSFLGLGIEPPNVSWGLLAADGLEAINPVRSFWWIPLFPSLAMGLTLFALNRLGDGLRDALDPRTSKLP